MRIGEGPESPHFIDGAFGSFLSTKQKIPKSSNSQLIDSIGIDIIGIFRLLRGIPRIPEIEMIIENVKYLIGSVSGT